jgi:hypothetical protein
MAEHDAEREAFLAKIGQVKPVEKKEPKQPKKDEE